MVFADENVFSRLMHQAHASRPKAKWAEIMPGKTGGLPLLSEAYVKAITATPIYLGKHFIISRPKLVSTVSR